MTQPNAHDLLEIARATLLEQLLPALPGELRYPALMIANAMTIAARESRQGAQAEDQEQAQLAALVEEAPSTLPEMRRQLASAIRQGSHDAPQSRRILVEALRQVTLARLAISNPKALP
ncbi:MULTISPECIES: DUF6285 domain-containing protein [Pseudomonas]|uniref:Acyl-CoA dehydrogenase n=1 Tax=Pseudomonas plecoglossicida TaxID=70775 RepID=A0ABX4UB34_PSEDL|nr:MULTISPECIES: DUF6285 domain-containing protein [Pseudomonas]PLU87341.1 acyl-CoA dehydrogenase [Pseudomonas plecoglossicida]PLU92932.1 acyl-CoA dehydrogenase [Pseudomonas plecoglossicida]PLV02528.1 acyl-CoA dehydrogenase [Pseudomonas plecoglossicida]PLV16767.1 acyl-CoA dehydrogenase [Pseudomonas plecoglossicida]